jgi:hypothetical protein
MWITVKPVENVEKSIRMASPFEKGPFEAQGQRSMGQAAVVDGVIHDTSDCSREGTRFVYGYWQKV